MSRKLIIFGNGLGRALDNDYFQLKAAMKFVWESDWLTPQEKLLIGSLRDIDSSNGPTKEEHLTFAYTALFGVSLLRASLDVGQLNKWLIDTAKDFPSVLEKYIYAVAYYFQQFEFDEPQKDRWTNFTQPLIDFIYYSHSHVATLNYDTLLYDPFNKQKITGTDHSLCRKLPSETKLEDSFGAKGVFDPKRFNWYPDNHRGKYMHLHGSPLFHTNNENKPAKCKRSELPNPDQFGGRTQIILGPSGLKPELINDSIILKDYWNIRLPRCIKEADEIILFGYGGADSHLNDLLNKHTSKTKIHVVERNQEGTLEERKKIWSDRLTGTINPILLDDILDFTDWEDPSKQASIPYSEFPF